MEAHQIFAVKENRISGVHNLNDDITEEERERETKFLLVQP